MGTIFIPFRSTAVNADALALYNAMVSYWQFDENDSGSTFADSANGPSAGNRPLTVRETGGTTTTSSTTTSTGVINGRAFNANLAEGRTAYIPASAGFKLPNSDWSFGGWFRNINSAGGSSRFVMGNIGSAGTSFQARMSIDGTNSDLQFACSTDGSTATNIDSNFVATAGVFALIVGTLDRTNNTIKLRWRNTSAGSMSSASAAFAGALFTGTVAGNFNINDGLSSDSTYFSGTRAGVTAADLCFYMTKAITDSEFDYLFHAGAGRTWAQIASDAGH